MLSLGNITQINTSDTQYEVPFVRRELPNGETVVLFGEVNAAETADMFEQAQSCEIHYDQAAIGGGPG